MSSFPTRITRSQLGPQFRDVYPVENPETDIGAGQFSAAFDQIAGCNVIVPRAALVASWNGASFDVHHQAEAWNTDNSQAHPVLARTGTGRYSYTFAATYLDGEGNVITTSLPAIRIFPNGPPADENNPYPSRVNFGAWRKISDPLVVLIALFDLAGTAIDAPFWLEVL